jgi:amino acid adenylation domain-containing protein
VPLSFHKRSSETTLQQPLPAEWSRSFKTSRPGSYATRAVLVREAEVLENAARALGTTLEDFVLTGFATLLARLTRQDTIIISAGKSHLVQFDLDTASSFRSILGKKSASNRKDVQRTPEQRVQYDFTAGEEQPSYVDDCALRLSVADNGLHLEMASPTGAWRENKLNRLLCYLMALLEAAGRNAETPLQQLPLWDEARARGFYEILNATDTEFPGEPTVTGRFSAQVKRRAQETAVLSGVRHYTYRELDVRSTELARHLVSLGAGANRAVAVCMDRSVDLPMALLAVLKSGSFYVPLEPSHPQERLRGILDECNPVVLLSDTATAVSMRVWLAEAGIPLHCVDSKQPVNINAPALPAEIDPAQLAYTIYTSGTTGKPKGVRITHRSLLNLICSFWQQPGLSKSDRTLGVAPISFDIASMDMFLPICSGGTLVIANKQDSVDPYRLGRLIDEQQITCMQATPATWRLLVSSGWSGKRSLKMLCGGEAISRELAEDLLRLGGELWNCYGPTETTIWSGVQRVKHGTGSVPVGPPIANTSFYVMDQGGYPLPPGVPGELYIGGRGVSPGYVARPELNAERFVPDRFGPDPARFLFRTGDSVRLIDGNQLEFFGRLDHQVKLRGYRIELGEIESVLRRHPAVSDAVVLLREDIPGEPRLAAYVIWTDDRVTSAMLGEFATMFLPEYMLPAFIVRMDRFPLSTAGKIDRRAMPVPESISSLNGSTPALSEDPSDALEDKLLKIFRETLRNDTIGVTDSFFRYGGYSLLTIRLFSRIDRDLHVRLPISLLFDAPTVRELAQVIRKGIVPSTIVPIRPYGRSAPIFLIQSYLLYNAMLEMVEPDRPVYGVREMGDERDPATVEERAAQFASEILAVYPGGPLYLAGWCAAGTLTVEIARQLRESGHQVGLVALFDAEHPAFVSPNGIGAWMSRLSKKASFHWMRLRGLPWRKREDYLVEALGRNWEAAIEFFDGARYLVLAWLKRRFGISLSGSAFYRVQADAVTLKSTPVRPYPGKLNLYRAQDVPDRMESDSTLGWGSVAGEGVKVDFVPGDHVSMFKMPNVANLAGRLQREMQNCEAAPRA